METSLGLALELPHLGHSLPHGHAFDTAGVSRAGRLGRVPRLGAGAVVCATSFAGVARRGGRSEYMRRRKKGSHSGLRGRRRRR
jgi:hypothetical protein